jgi:hypothetical protein
MFTKFTFFQICQKMRINHMSHFRAINFLKKDRQNNRSGRRYFAAHFESKNILNISIYLWYLHLNAWRANLHSMPG